MSDVAVMTLVTLVLQALALGIVIGKGIRDEDHDKDTKK